MSTDNRDERIERRVSDLYATERQFADARSSEAIELTNASPELRLPQIVHTVLDGYADRPALGQRFVQSSPTHQRAAHPRNSHLVSTPSPIASCRIGSTPSRPL